eukprot:g21351.t1
MKRYQVVDVQFWIRNPDSNGIEGGTNFLVSVFPTGRQLLKDEKEGQLSSRPSDVVSQNGDVGPRTEKPSTSTSNLLPQGSPLNEPELDGAKDSLSEETHKAPKMDVGQPAVKSEKTSPLGPRDSGNDSTSPGPEKLRDESTGTGDIDRQKSHGEGHELTEQDRAKGEGCRFPLERPPLQTGTLTLANLRLMVDLFYLPYEHGEETAGLLREFHWLKTNSDFVSANAKMELKKVSAVKNQTTLLWTWSH